MPAILLFLASIFLWCAASAHAAPEYRILENTESPDHRYAIAWGLPEKYKVDWGKLRAGDEGEFESVGDFYDQTENYLIDLKNQRIIHKLQSHYWSFPGHNANHRDLEVVWTPSSDLVLVLYSLRFDYGSFTAYRLEDKKVVKQVDLGKPLENAFRNHLRKSVPTAYRRTERSLVYWFDTVTFHGDHFSVRADASVPKSDREEDLSSTVRITFDLAGAKLRIREIQAEDKDQLWPLADQEALAQADLHLNAAYKRLRSQLVPAEKEQLKREQLDWLAQLDEIRGAGPRARFIEGRVKELEERAKR